MANEPQANAGNVAELTPSSVVDTSNTAEPEVDWKAKALETESNLKAAQRNLSQREAKLATLERQGTDVTALKTEFDSIKENQAKTLDYLSYVMEKIESGNANLGYLDNESYGLNDEPPKRKRGMPTLNIDAYNKQKADEEAKNKEAGAFQQDYDDLLEALETAGLNPDDPDVREFFKTSCTGPRDGLKKVPALQKLIAGKRVIETKNEAEAREKETARLKAEETGALDNLGGNFQGGSQGIPTDRDKFRKWINDLPVEEYAKRHDEISRMVSGGLIK